MIYGATGTLQITEVARGTARILQSDHPRRPCSLSGWCSSSRASRSSGRGALPYVDPDVYHGAPSAVTLFILPGPSSRRSRWRSGCW